MALLILARHGETAWNASRRLTGTADIPINNQGLEQALLLAEHLRSIPLAAVYISALKRTYQTYSVVQKALGLTELTPIRCAQFNERDCGALTGRYKSELDIRELEMLDRDWDYVPLDGESLAMVHERVIPFFTKEILPQLLQGRNIMVISHYNTMRLLKAHIEKVPVNQRSKISVSNGELAIYDIPITSS